LKEKFVSGLSLAPIILVVYVFTAGKANAVNNKNTTKKIMTCFLDVFE
jgi:hypothetical protein